MKKEFIPYEQALVLKELGFDEGCFGYYENNTFIFWHDSRQDYELLLNCSAPTFSQAFRWFRDKFNLIGYIQTSYINYDKEHETHCSPRIEFTFGATNTEGENIINSFNQKDYKTHEESELECLKKLIEIAKSK